MRKHNKYTTNLIILVKRLAASESTNIFLKILFFTRIQNYLYIYNYKIVHCQVNILDQFTTKFKI